MSQAGLKETEGTRVCSVCGKPICPGAPLGLCVECFRTSTGLSAQDYGASTVHEEQSTASPPAGKSTTADETTASGLSELKAGLRLNDGRYELTRQLGAGGMGEVWLAEDRQLCEGGASHLAALKFLSPAIRKRSEALNFLRREVLRGRTLSHPNIVQVHDWSQRQGEPVFFSMEYVKGAALDVLLSRRRGGYYNWIELAPLAKQLCSAIHYAHEQAVLHRDIKPGNILVSNDGHLKLGDFGIALPLSEAKAVGLKPLRSSGTPAYMSPQQRRGEPPTVADDVYSLGATFYELLAGEPPLFEEDPNGGERLVPLAEQLAVRGPSDVPPHIQRSIERCLASDPACRPRSVYQLAGQLGLVDTGTARPIDPADDSPRRRPRASVRPVVWAIVAILAVATVLVVRQELGPRDAGQPGATRGPTNATAVPLTNELATPVPRTTPSPTAAVVTQAPPVSPPSAAAAPPLILTTQAPPPPPPASTAVVPPVIAATQVPPPPPPAPAVSSVVVVKPLLRIGPQRGERWTNSLGMLFVPVPDSGVLLCAWETRRQDFFAYTNACYSSGRLPRDLVRWRNLAFTGRRGQPAAEEPVVGVTWKQATNFCAWLTEVERAANLLAASQRYRLPTAAEWLRALGATEPTRGSRTPPPFLWGNTTWPPPAGAYNLAGAELAETAVGSRLGRIPRYRDAGIYPVGPGRFPTNALGFHHLIGNVWELCQDAEKLQRAALGGAWTTAEPEELRLGYRNLVAPDVPLVDVGFRCAIAVSDAASL